MALDDRDFRILKILAENSKLSSRHIAKMTGFSPATVTNRIRKMAEGGIIVRNCAILDHRKIGYDMTVVVSMIMTRGDANETKSEIAKIPNVCCVYDVTGRTDVVVIAKFKTTQEANDFRRKLHVLPGVERTMTHIVLNTLKEDFRVI